jgi:hypothetical protein
MKQILTTGVAFVLGFCAAQYFQKPEKQLIRLDSVTLKETELDSLVQAVSLVREKLADHKLFRYETNSGSLAFECPTSEACNLEVPARGVERMRERQVIIHESQTQQTSPRRLSFADLGLRNGDVVTEINGKSVGSPSFAISEISRLLKEDGALQEITVVRDGENTKLRFNVASSQ